jgi:hypothetical protein
MKHIPMCWKCADAVMEKTSGLATVMKLTSCRRKKSITCYEDAEEECPLIAKK